MSWNSGYDSTGGFAIWNDYDYTGSNIVRVSKDERTREALISDLNDHIQALKDAKWEISRLNGELDKAENEVEKLQVALDAVKEMAYCFKQMLKKRGLGKNYSSEWVAIEKAMDKLGYFDSKL